jgi:hypothetical protein
MLDRLWELREVFIPSTLSPTSIFLIHSSHPTNCSFSLLYWCPTTFVHILVIPWGVWLKESMRLLEKIKILHSWALGEALDSRCVPYSWSFAPRWLEVAQKLPIDCGWALKSLYCPLWLSGTLQPTTLVVDWRRGAG